MGYSIFFDMTRMVMYGIWRLMSLMHGFEDKSSQQQWRSEFHAYYCCGANKGQGWANPMQEEEQEKLNYDFNQVGVRTGIMQLSITSHWICTWVAYILRTSGQWFSLWIDKPLCWHFPTIILWFRSCFFWLYRSTYTRIFTPIACGLRSHYMGLSEHWETPANGCFYGKNEENYSQTIPKNQRLLHIPVNPTITPWGLVSGSYSIIYFTLYAYSP